MSEDIRKHIYRLEEVRKEALGIAESKASELKRFFDTLSQDEIKKCVLKIKKEIEDSKSLIKLQEKNCANLGAELIILQFSCKHPNKDADSEGNKTAYICKDCGYPWVEDFSISKFYHQ